MQARIAKFSAYWDTEGFRPDLAVTNVTRFLVGCEIVVLPCGALFLSKGVGNKYPTSIFQIDLSIETNETFFTRFSDIVTFDDGGFFTSCKSYSIGGVEAVIYGVDGDYRMFANRYGHLCIKKVPGDPGEIMFKPDFPVT
ncbi:MAG: hypothetical protein WC229_02870 [Candidatus Paceibacterota bacterium]|jgi:hypothetical protein